MREAGSLVLVAAILGFPSVRLANMQPKEAEGASELQFIMAASRQLVAEEKAHL